MPDEIDPMLLRMMRRGLPTSGPTRGAGLFDNPSIMRSLQINQPRIIGGQGKSMPGFSPAKPGAGAIPSMGNPHLTEQENHEDTVPPGPLSTKDSWNDPTKKYGPVMPGEPSVDRLPHYVANDPRNPLMDKLEGIRRHKMDEEGKYNMALGWQRMNREPAKPQEPTFKSSMAPIKEDIKPRSSLDIKQIHGAAAKLEAKGLKEDATNARQYNFKTEQYKDKIKDYNLAHSDLQGWVNKNSVPDLHQGFEDMDRINSLLVKGKQPSLTFPEYQQMKIYELQRKLQQTGQEKFYADLKTNLTTMHSDLDRIHKLIEDHKD